MLPELKKTHRLFAYDFATNKVPGFKSYEEPAYWRDVGTLNASFNAHQIYWVCNRVSMCLTRSGASFPVTIGGLARILDATIHNSVIAAGSLVHQASIRNTIIRREVDRRGGCGNQELRDSGLCLDQARCPVA